MTPGGVVGADSTPLDLHRNELAAEAVRRFGELRLQVSGSSMLPALLPGDELLVRRCGIEQARAGEIVLFIRHRRLFAHRVVAHSEEGLITQGDGVAEPDPCVSGDELLGKVIRVARGGRTLRCGSKRALPARVVAMVFSHFPIAGRFFARLFVFLHGPQRRASP